MDLTLVVLAAGIGSRFGGLKQLEPIGPQGETLLEYSIYDALRAGFDRIVLVVRRETEEQFLRAFAQGMARQVALTYVHQTTGPLPVGVDVADGRHRPWGTGQAILAAEPVVEGRFAVVNADDFYGEESYSTLAEFLRGTSSENVVAMLGFSVGQTLTDAGPASRALCRLDEQGRLERIVEIDRMWKRDRGGVYLDAEGQEVSVAAQELVSMNMWGFSRALFAELRQRFARFLADQGSSSQAEFLIPDVVQALIAEGRAEVEVLRRTGRWCGVTYPEDKPRAAAMIGDLVAAGRYPSPLWD